MSDLRPRQRVRTVWWEESATQEGERDVAADLAPAYVGLLDQTRLPSEVITVRLAHERDVAEAIVTLKVRGAPAIGVTAAYGVALAVWRLLCERGAMWAQRPAHEALPFFLAACNLLAATRPTAVNLFWAIERMRRCGQQLCATDVSVRTLAAALLAEAQTIADEDAAACQRMGNYGAALIAAGDSLLTHCNTGALATSGIGTALAPIYTAARQGKSPHVFVDETRPILQGARLTAWELQQEGIDLTLITDTMAGYFMRQKAIQAVFVGADRIAANGDVANKIGTYSLSVLAHVHQIPFYVVAPCSSIDLTLSSGEQIPIELRKPDEVTTILGTRIAPEGVKVANPAFDVTPQCYITAIVTDQGIARPPYAETLTALVQTGG